MTENEVTLIDGPRDGFTVVVSPQVVILKLPVMETEHGWVAIYGEGSGDYAEYERTGESTFKFSGIALA